MSTDMKPESCVVEPSKSNDSSDETSIIETGATFDSYESFKTAFEEWKGKNLYPFRVASSKQLDLSRGDELNLEKFKYRYIIFNCVHYGQPRMRGEGKRSMQNYLAKGCNATLRLVFDFGSQKLLIRKLCAEHMNHDLSKENYAQYIQNQKHCRKHSSRSKRPLPDPDPDVSEQALKLLNQEPSQQMKVLATEPVPNSFSLKQLIWYNAMILTRSADLFSPNLFSQMVQPTLAVPVNNSPTTTNNFEPSANSAFSKPPGTLQTPVSTLTPDLTPMSSPPISDQLLSHAELIYQTQLRSTQNSDTLEALSILKSMEIHLKSNPLFVNIKKQQLVTLLQIWNNDQ